MTTNQMPADWAPTPQGFCDALGAAGLDADLCCHGGPGMPRVPTGYLRDGRGWIMADQDGCLGDTDAPYDRPLPGPDALGVQVYESMEENAPRWPERDGLVFNDPVGLLWGDVTPARAFAAILAADAGDYSRFSPALLTHETVPVCFAPPPVEWALTSGGLPMFDRRTRFYLRAVGWSSPSHIGPFKTRRCPDCDQDVEQGGPLVADTRTGGAHVVMHDSVVLGCEGLFVVDPQAVGEPREGWEDWRTGLEPDPATLDQEAAFITLLAGAGERLAAPADTYRVSLFGEVIGRHGSYPEALRHLRLWLAGLNPLTRPEDLRVFYTAEAADLRVEFPFPLSEIRADWDRPTRPEDAEWFAGLGPHIGVEALCLLCGETCNPAGPDEMTHNRTTAEEPCGGPLVPLGAWA